MGPLPAIMPMSAPATAAATAAAAAAAATVSNSPQSPSSPSSSGSSSSSSSSSNSNSSSSSSSSSSTRTGQDHAPNSAQGGPSSDSILKAAAVKTATATATGDDEDEDEDDAPFDDLKSLLGQFDDDKLQALLDGTDDEEALLRSLMDAAEED